ncbi:hypothetical protein HK104_003452 [Borealophlyctis nickersoniae]|nr:hypothetical protein HK104_003452 [Borealophlyctis nickersoniae]
MDQTFSTIFRSSRLAALQPNQVIRVPASSASTGTLGLKYPYPVVPKAFNPVYVTCENLDDPVLKRAQYRPAVHKVQAIKMWKENFPPPGEVPIARKWAMDSFKGDEIKERIRELKEQAKGLKEGETPSSSPHDRTKSDIFDSTTDKPVAYLTPEEYSLALTYARARGPSFRRDLATRQATVSSVPEALHLKFDQDPSTRGRRTFVRITPPPDVPVHPPVYTVDPVAAKRPHKVWGRILNPVNGGAGHAVAVAGIVAYLPGKEINESGAGSWSSRSQMREFYVRLARHDGQGRPEVVLSMQPPGIKEKDNAALKTIAGLTGLGANDGASVWGKGWASRETKQGMSKSSSEVLADFDSMFARDDDLFGDDEEAKGEKKDAAGKKDEIPTLGL